MVKIGYWERKLLIGGTCRMLNLIASIEEHSTATEFIIMMFISFNEYSAVLDQAFHPFSSGHPTAETYQTSLKTREQEHSM